MEDDLKNKKMEDDLITTNVTKNSVVTNHFKRHREKIKSGYLRRDKSFAACAHIKDDNSQNKDDL